MEGAGTSGLKNMLLFAFYWLIGELLVEVDFWENMFGRLFELLWPYLLKMLFCVVEEDCATLGKIFRRKEVLPGGSVGLFILVGLEDALLFPTVKIFTFGCSLLIEFSFSERKFWDWLLLLWFLAKRFVDGWILLQGYSGTIVLFAICGCWSS